MTCVGSPINVLHVKDVLTNTYYVILAKTSWAYSTWTYILPEHDLFATHECYGFEMRCCFWVLVYWLYYIITIVSLEIVILCPSPGYACYCPPTSMLIWRVVDPNLIFFSKSDPGPIRTSGSVILIQNSY